MRYTISQQATEDLERIWLYTYYRWSERQADKYYGLLVKHIEYIAQHTTAGRRMDDIKAGYMYLPVESHIIFYTVAANDAVTVIRILHKQMNLPGRLQNPDSV